MSKDGGGSGGSCGDRQSMWAFGFLPCYARIPLSHNFYLR